jgi:magnesium-transporting ATPase (P-type)
VVATESLTHILFCGSAIRKGAGRGVVLNVGRHTIFGKIIGFV